MGDRNYALRLGGGLLLWYGAAVLGRDYLEASMLRHVLIQLPALAVVGVLLSPRSPAQDSSLAMPALLLALVTAAVWMLPRMLDSALVSGLTEIAKLTTIPLLVGAPLAWSWPRLSGLTRSFVWANLVSMLLTLGWLYLAAPSRVCNAYLLAEQKQLGVAFLALAVFIVAALLPRAFFRSDGAQTSARAASA